MEIKTSELLGPALDWAVAEVMGLKPQLGINSRVVVSAIALGLQSARWEWFQPSTDWSQGGPIIEREGVSLAAPSAIDSDWVAFSNMLRNPDKKQHGPAPLVAAMRCYVASKNGNEIEVPDELFSKTP